MLFRYEFMGYMRCTPQIGAYHSQDDVLRDREMAYWIFGTRDVVFQEPHGLLAGFLFEFFHIVEVWHRV